MSHNSFIVYSTCLITLIFLNGCAKTREVFGLNRHQPDEFTTPSRPPLEKPKDLQLVTPKKGALSQGHIKTEQHVLEIVAGKNKSNNLCHDVSTVEHNLLKEIKAEQVPSDIREKINHETAYNSHQPDSVVRKMLFWQRHKAAGEIIDPVKEYAKLQQQNDQIK